MLLKILGAIDLILGLILILLGTGILIPKDILIIAGGILLVKSSFCVLKDFASWVDFIGGGIFLLSIMVDVPEMIVIISGLLIAQKGIFSFL